MMRPPDDANFALRNDAGDEHPEQVAYVNGYGIAERLLEDVRFKVERMALGTGFHLVCNGVHLDDEPYMRKFNNSQRAVWQRDAVRQMEQYDADATAEDGTNVHWGEA